MHGCTYLPPKETRYAPSIFPANGFGSGQSTLRDAWLWQWIRRPADSFEQCSLYLVDLESGEVRRRADGLVPIDYWDWRRTIFLLAFSLPGGRQRNLYRSADAALVEFDPVTGTRRTLIGPTHFQVQLRVADRPDSGRSASA